MFYIVFLDLVEKLYLFYVWDDNDYNCENEG